MTLNPNLEREWLVTDLALTQTERETWYFSGQLPTRAVVKHLFRRPLQYAQQLKNVADSFRELGLHSYARVVARRTCSPSQQSSQPVSPESAP